jgi:16S rRNA (cytidine1402-2'-O)-methyltransferase
VARELTKIHEEFLRGKVGDARRELAARDRIRGEITLLVEALPPTRAEAGAQPANAAPEKIVAQLARLQAESDINEKEALKRLARQSGLSKSELYRQLQRERARLR